MRSTRYVLSAAMLAICGIALAQEKPAATMWDEVASKDARAAVLKGLNAIEKMDIEGFKSVLAEEATAYDLDFESKPLKMKTRAEAIMYIEALSSEAKKMGATMKFDKLALDCHATSTLAHCIMEYDFVVTLPDTSKIVQPSQTSGVLSKDNDGWKWVHWHTSLSVLPADTEDEQGEEEDDED